MFKKIVVGIDFSSASQAALFGGISLATKCLARIEAVHVITLLKELYSPSRFVIPDSDWKSDLSRKFDEFFPKKLYPNSNRTILAGRSVSQDLLRYARENNCDLIVVGTYGATTVGDLLIGSVAQQLARISEIPVMVVRDVKHVVNHYQGFSRVLVPTDFSDTAEKSLHFGVRLANFFKGDLHLVHSVDLPSIEEIYESYPFARTKLPDTCELNVDSVLDECVGNKELIGNKIVATLVGDPVMEILKYAEKEHIDFIVMGTHGRKGLERILLGSVVSGVLSKSSIPVITLSPIQERFVTRL
jgi:nucleotide-binding universal stress UspA family protein